MSSELNATRNHLLDPIQKFKENHELLLLSYLCQVVERIFRRNSRNFYGVSSCRSIFDLFNYQYSPTTSAW
jgi:hypothetical protein